MISVAFFYHNNSTDGVGSYPLHTGKRPWKPPHMQGARIPEERVQIFTVEEYCQGELTPLTNRRVNLQTGLF